MPAMDISCCKHDLKRVVECHESLKQVLLGPESVILEIHSFGYSDGRNMS
jgi:hypothetical protein